MHALQALADELPGISPVFQPLPGDPHNPITRMIVVVDDPDHLDQQMGCLSKVLGQVERRLRMPDTFQVRSRNLSYSEPPGASRQFAEPFHPIPQLFIRPAPFPVADTPDANTILLDPGHAFGTGKHPSTILCLQAMHRMSQSTRPVSLRGADVLDFGCGTGLLAIAAVKMGAQSALGIEIDRASAETARANVLRNGLADRIEIREGSWEEVRGRYAVLFVNLVPAAILRTGSRLPLHLQYKGLAVIAGFGHQQAEDIKASFTSCGLCIGEQMDLEGWSALVVRRA
jgi:ribosomal protein L11 methyltransferase